LFCAGLKLTLAPPAMPCLLYAPESHPSPPEVLLSVLPSSVMFALVT
jgi:hypothetical protein